MANIRKSFNFRSGLQVDNDNFVVNSNGLVGIGTSVPTQYLLNVYGDTRVTGVTTTGSLSVSGVSTFQDNVNIGDLVQIDSSSGIITASSFYGDGSTLSNVFAVATAGWVAQGVGLHTSKSIGIGTTNPEYKLQIGENPNTGSGVGINDNGNIKVSGISTFGVTTITDLTAQSLSVSGVTTTTDLTAQSLNVSGISTISTLKVGADIIASGGVVAATTFDGTLTGVINSSGISTLGVATITDLTAQSLNVSGVSTITVLKVGTAITASGGIITATTFDGTAVTATSFTTARDFSITGDLEASAVSFNGTANVALASTLSSSFSANTSGIVTAATIVGSAGSFGSIGVGTATPSTDIQIRKASGQATLEVISDTDKASINIGNSINAGTNSGSIFFGSSAGFGVYSTDQSFNISNQDTGNFNYFLSNSVSSDSGFRWHKGSTETLMTLTGIGSLGIGITDPQHLLSVQGISTFTGAAYFNNNVTIDGILSITSGSFTGDVTGDVKNISNDVIVDVSEALLNGNVNTTTGISTFNNIKSEGVGIGTTSPRCVLDLKESTGNSTGFVLLPTRTLAGRENITPLIEGALIYNSTNKRLEFYNGTAWVGVATEA